jgi:hypothetical protein
LIDEAVATGARREQACEELGVSVRKVQRWAHRAEDGRPGAVQAWVQRFVQWYNEEHRHSGIRYVTPAQRHPGEAPVFLRHRMAVYEAARERQPLRWSGKTRNWFLPDAVWLNPEREVDRGQKRKAT